MHALYTNNVPERIVENIIQRNVFIHREAAHFTAEYLAGYWDAAGY